MKSRLGSGKAVVGRVGWRGAVVGWSGSVSASVPASAAGLSRAGFGVGAAWLCLVVSLPPGLVVFVSGVSFAMVSMVMSMVMLMVVMVVMVVMAMMAVLAVMATRDATQRTSQHEQVDVNLLEPVKGHGHGTAGRARHHRELLSHAPQPQRLSVDRENVACTWVAVAVVMVMVMMVMVVVVGRGSKCFS